VPQPLRLRDSYGLSSELEQSLKKFHGRLAHPEHHLFGPFHTFS
jgi:hypothetical protein